jgi:hypothetical protein
MPRLRPGHLPRCKIGPRNSEVSMLRLLTEGLAAADSGQCDAALARNSDADEMPGQTGQAPSREVLAIRRCMTRASQSQSSAPAATFGALPPSATGLVCVLPDRSGMVVKSKEACRSRNGLIYD